VKSDGVVNLRQLSINSSRNAVDFTLLRFR